MVSNTPLNNERLYSSWFRDFGRIVCNNPQIYYVKKKAGKITLTSYLDWENLFWNEKARMFDYRSD